MEIYYIFLLYILTILGVILIYNRDVDSRAQKQSSFRRLVWMLMVMVIVDVIGRIGVTDTLTLVASWASNYFSYIIDPIYYFLVFQYINDWLDEDRIFYGMMHNIILVFVILNTALVTFSQIARVNWFFDFNGPGGQYQRGSLYLVRAIVIITIFFMILVYTLINKNHILAVNKGTLIAFPMIPVVFGVLQPFVPGMCFEYVGMSLSCLVLLISVQSNSANLDAMTGTMSRRRLNMVINNIDARKERSDAYAFMMIDINNFKGINDKYGHQEGDEAIKTVADAIGRSIRKSDVLCRYGGDEFGILMLHCLPDTPESVNERISRSLTSVNASHMKPYELSVSIGWSVCKPLDTRKVDDVIKDADDAMYENKKLYHKEHNIPFR